MAIKLKPLKDQTILITGASSGIGLATAREAARRGANVVLVARNGDVLTQIAEEIGAKALAVPKGEYTLFVDVSNPDAWTLVVNKQTGQWGLDYDKKQDLGRVPMAMTRPASPVEQLKYTLTANGSNAATLRLAWEQHVATVPIAVK